MQCEMVSVLTSTDGTIAEVPNYPRRAKNNPVSILLIEDTRTDAMLTRIALDATKLPYNLRTLSNGCDAANYIIDQFNNGAVPDLIMLDLGLPTMNGFEILDMLAAGPAAIRAIPIIILTGYEHFEYIGKNYNLWIPAYMNKPCNAEKIREVLSLVARRRG